MANAAPSAPNPWIVSRRWDLTWLIGSVLCLPIAPLLYHLGLTANDVALVILVAVGGPHVFVTFTRTNMDPRFVRGHKVYANLAYLIPVLTAAFAFWNTALFLTVFFAWASLHVLQQIAYVANSYSNRQALAPTSRERFFEYGVIFSCLYPFATVRMVDGTFTLDGIRLLVPEALLGPGLVYTSFGLFGAFTLGWLFFVAKRIRAKSLHYGKTTLIGVTAGATFLTPLFPNLDVAFQGINTWHCIQYLALIWWTNRIRMQKGEVEWSFVQRLSREGVRGFIRYYGSAVVGTVSILALILVVQRVTGMNPLLAYYMVGKGVLLTHYYYDTFLFTQRDEITSPSTIPQVSLA